MSYQLLPDSINAPACSGVGATQIMELNRPVVQPEGYGYQPVSPDFTCHAPIPAHDHGVPPAYYNNPPPVQQWVDPNIAIVQEQPPPIVRPPDPPPAGMNRDGVLMFSIVLTVLGVVCILGCLCFILVCSIPALFLAIMAKENDQQGKTEEGNAKARASLGLNITAIVVFVIALLAISIVALVQVLQNRQLV